MKINAKRDDLLGPLLHAGNVVERRQTLPILANLLIRCREGKLELTATDLEVQLTTTTTASLASELEFTLPARKLIDICKALPDGADICIDVEGDKATLRSGRGRYTMGILPAQDYPSIEPSPASEAFVLSEGVIKRLIEKTAFAMAQQDVRYYLNGLLLEIHGNRIRAVATDGHRLAVCDAELENTAGGDIQVILPRKAVIELGRLLADSDDELRLEINNSHVQFLFGNTKFTTKLIDGRFPDYERVIPVGEVQDLRVDKDSFRQALTRTSILSNEKYRGIRFRIAEGLLHLQAHNPEQDEAEEELEVDYHGEEMIIGFNVGYLLDVLNVIDSEQVNMALIDANSSTLITPVDGNDCRYVVMPMRL